MCTKRSIRMTVPRIKLRYATGGLVGKTKDVTGVGIGKVLSFNKVDNMKRIRASARCIR